MITRNTAHCTYVLHGMGMALTIPATDIEAVAEQTFHDLTTYGQEFEALYHHVSSATNHSEVHIHLYPGLFEAVFDAAKAVAKGKEDVAERYKREGGSVAVRPSIRNGSPRDTGKEAAPHA